MPFPYSDGRTLRLNVTTIGGFVLSVKGIVAVAVSVMAVCLSMSDNGAADPTPVALPFAMSRVHVDTLIVFVTPFIDPSYESVRRMVVFSMSAIGIPE